MAFALLGGQQLELARHARRQLLAGARPGVAGGLQQLQPRAPGGVAAHRAAHERLDARAQTAAPLPRQPAGEARVAEPEARAGGERRRRIAGVRLLAQALLDARGRQRVEAHLLAARGDRGQQLARGGGEQDEVRERRGLLERLQQAVGGLVVERVRVLQHEHPPARLERRAGRRGDDRLVDVAHQHFPRAGGRDPRQIRVRPARRAPAHLLGSGRPRGEQRRGEGARDRALADAGGAVEEVGVSRPPPAPCPPAEASSPSRNLSAGSSTARACGWASRPGQAHAVNRSSAMSRYVRRCPRAR